MNEDPNSVLNFWKRALDARKKNEVRFSLSPSVLYIHLLIKTQHLGIRGLRTPAS